MNFSYLEFENRFRGSRAQVREEQKNHLSYFVGKSPVLDIGCGRGEFLELLKEHGTADAYGIDIDDGMIDCSRSRGLEVIKEDALHHLEQLPDDSLQGVFMSHVAEHFTPANLLTLIGLIHRKLASGHFFLAETLNPQCVFSMGPYFMDFSHVFPVHPQTFSFLLESQGFSDIDMVYRQYLPPDFLTLDPIPSSACTGSPFETAYTNTVTKLQIIINQVFMNFIYCIVGKK